MEELLDLYNNLIHDLEIGQGVPKDKPKAKKPENTTEEVVKNKRRTLLVKKAKGASRKKCVLCLSENHNIRSHHLSRDGVYTVDEIRKVLQDNNLCQKCCNRIEAGSACESANCANVTRECFHCASKDHHSLICPDAKPNTSQPSSKLAPI